MQKDNKDRVKFQAIMVTLKKNDLQGLKLVKVMLTPQFFKILTILKIMKLQKRCKLPVSDGYIDRPWQCTLDAFLL